jgi:hypothetical protein
VSGVREVPGRPRADESVGDILASHARRTSDGWLVAHVAIGMAVAVAALAVPSTAALVPVAAGLASIAFGLWGIFDRELTERGERAPPSGHMPLRVARALAAALGAVAVLAALFALLALSLGTWIS